MNYDFAGREAIGRLQTPGEAYKALSLHVYYNGLHNNYLYYLS